MTETLEMALGRIRALRSLTAAAAHDLDSPEATTALLEAAAELTASATVAMVGSAELTVAGGGKVERAGAEDRYEPLIALAHDWLGSRTDDAPRVTIRRAGTTVLVAPEQPDARLRAFAFDRAGGVPYSVLDLELIEAVVATAAGMLALTRLRDEEAERVRLDHEHDMASRIAQATLADAPPAVDGMEVFARSQRARRAGGDFYAFAAAGDLLHFAVGDVAGKGLPAAIVMGRMVTACHAAFRGADAGGHDGDVGAAVAAAFAAVADELSGYLGEIGRFVTLTIGSLDPQRGTLRLCNAGHSPVLVERDRVFRTVKASSPPLGVPFIESRPRVEELQLAPGDALYLGSDGLVDQDDRHGNPLGYDGFTRLCEAVATGSAADRGAAIFDAITPGGAEAVDDRTLVILRRAEAA